jgi:20S proteasome subunit beta 7
MDGGRQRTQSPIVTGTSVIALKFAGGVLMAADTLGSYGSLARFTDQRRLTAVHNSTLIGAGGDFSDFQHIQDKLGELELYDFNQDDGCDTSAPEIYHYLQRLLYHRRNKFDPLWNTVVVGGLHPETKVPFLGQVNMIGLAFEGDYIATGFGHHLGMPLLRNHWRPDMPEADARKLLEECMRICFYRDCRSINRIQFAKVDAEGVTVSEPVKIDTKWDFELFVNTKSEFGASW